MTIEQEFLKSTNQMIELRLADAGTKTVSLAGIAAHLCLAPNAKRVRPRLCFLYSQLLQNTGSDVIRLAVASEFIHTASLLHDDVIDDSQMRRGQETANRVYGNSLAVLSGNFLLTEAFKVIEDLDKVLSDKALMVVREMSLASMSEILVRGTMDLDLVGWRKMAIGKTGALFSWCGFAAAILAKKPEAGELLWRVGSHVGQIFQMADDLKDFGGDQKLKDICRDIKNREPSLPVILAGFLDPSIKQKFATAFAEDCLNEATVMTLRELIYTSGAIAATKELMLSEMQSIKTLLEPFNGIGPHQEMMQWLDCLSTINE